MPAGALRSKRTQLHPFTEEPPKSNGTTGENSPSETWTFSQSGRPGGGFLLWMPQGQTRSRLTSGSDSKRSQRSRRFIGDRPKYTFASESQTEVLRESSVAVLELDAIYLRETGSKKAKLLFDDAPVTAEEYVRRHFEGTGYSVLDLESRPFHALFGIYMWLLVQDAADPNVRRVGFLDREGGREIWTHLPEDFGTPGYSVRRAEAIDEHCVGSNDCGPFEGVR